MRRRRFLYLATSGLAGLAGCQTGNQTGPAPTPDSPTPLPSPSRTPELPSTTLAVGETYNHPDGWSVTVSNARVQKIALRAGDHLDPVAFAGGQYVVVDVAVDGDPNGVDREGTLPAADSFAVALDGAYTTPDPDGFWAGQAGIPADEDGTVAMPVATAKADEAAVHWRASDDPVEWALGAAHREAIARSPTFKVREFAVPESVKRGAGFDASVTVANIGERDGTFLAELGATTISDTDEFQFEVPAGAVVDHDEPVGPNYPSEADELRIVLNWGLGRLERSIEIE